MIREADIEEIKSRLRSIETIASDNQKLIYELSLRFMKLSLQVELLERHADAFWGIASDIKEEENSRKDVDKSGKDEASSSGNMAPIYSIRSSKTGGTSGGGSH